MTTDTNSTPSQSFDTNGNNSFGPPPGFPGPPPVMAMPPFMTFEKYAYPVTIAFGLVGNFIIMYIFTQTKLKKTSTSRYLAATAVTDSGFLLTKLMTVLNKHYNIRVLSIVGPCQLVTFGNYVFIFLSTWYLTAVMVEKYIGVSWPRKKSRMCTVFRAKCVIISLALLGLVSYLYITWFFGVGQYGCGIFQDPRVLESWNILTRMDAIFNFAIPYIIIFIMTCLISYRTWTYHKISMSASERFLRRRRVTTPADKEFKTTPLLILLAASTLLFCTPNNSSSLRRVFTTERFIPSVSELRLMAIFLYLSIVSNSIKIVVYIAASNAFVKELGKMFCIVKRAWEHRNASNELQICKNSSRSSDTKTVATSTEGIV